MATYRLITLGPSHYCEKARWALERARIPFVEEPHAPALHALSTYRSGGKRTVPVLVTDAEVYPDSTDILELADGHMSGALFGHGEVRRRALELEEHFDVHLGPESRRLAYFHLIDLDALMSEAFGVGVGSVERASFRVLRAPIKGLMKRGMHIDAEGAKRSRERAQAIMREVSELLADGRRFLTGEQFTAADLTFAALAAPLVLPPEYGWPLPPFDSLPAPARSEARHFRDSRAGELVMRLYREERRYVPPPGS